MAERGGGEDVFMAERGEVSMAEREGGVVSMAVCVCV